MSDFALNKDNSTGNRRLIIQFGKDPDYGVVSRCVKTSQLEVHWTDGHVDTIQRDGRGHLWMDFGNRDEFGSYEKHKLPVVSRQCVRDTTVKEALRRFADQRGFSLQYSW